MEASVAPGGARKCSLRDCICVIHYLLSVGRVGR